MTTWLSRDQIAELFGVSVDTFDRKIRGHPDFPTASNLTGTREGLRWQMDEVDEWARNQRRAA